MTEQTEDRAQTAIARVLRLGSLISTLVMALGISLFVLRGTLGFPPATHAAGPGELLRSAVRFEPAGLAELGILLLLLTPVLRIVVAAASFALERDTKYVFISLGILAVIFGSILIALH